MEYHYKYILSIIIHYDTGKTSIIIINMTLCLCHSEVHSEALNCMKNDIVGKFSTLKNDMEGKFVGLEGAILDSR